MSHLDGLVFVVTGSRFLAFFILSAGIRTTVKVLLIRRNSAIARALKQRSAWQIVRTTSYAPSVHNHIRDSARSTRPPSTHVSENLRREAARSHPQSREARSPGPTSRTRT